MEALVYVVVGGAALICLVIGLLTFWLGSAKIGYDLYRGDPDGKEPAPVGGFLVFLLVFTAVIIGFFVMMSRHR